MQLLIWLLKNMLLCEVYQIKLNQFQFLVKFGINAYRSSFEEASKMKGECNKNRPRAVWREL